MNKVIGGAILALIGLFAISKKSSGKQPDIFDINDKPLPGGGGVVPGSGGGVLPMPDIKNPTDMLDDKWKIPNGTATTTSTVNCLVPPCPQIPGGSTNVAPIVTTTAEAPVNANASIDTEFESRKQSLVKSIERAGLSRDSFEKLSSKIISMNKDEVGVLEAFLRNAATRTPMDYEKGKKFKEVNTKYALFPPAMVAALISGAVLK